MVSKESIVVHCTATVCLRTESFTVRTMKLSTLLLTLSLLLLHFSSALEEDGSGGVQEYGVDQSWPMHYANFADDKSSHRFNDYWAHLAGCYKRYHEKVCDESEQERLKMNRKQPSFQRNFTSAGYAVVAAPEKAFALLKQFWMRNQGRIRKEEWDAGSIFINHWDVDTKILSVNDGMPFADRKIIIDQLQSVLSNWAGGVPLVPTSFYGIRVYSGGAILAPHVDRYAVYFIVHSVLYSCSCFSLMI